MDYFLSKYLGAIDQYQAYERFGLDMVIYDVRYKNGVEGGMFWSNKPLMQTAKWRVERKDLPRTSNGIAYKLHIHTPDGTLSMGLQTNSITTWVTEYLIKEKDDIRLIDYYMPYPSIDTVALNHVADGIGDRGVLRTHVFGYGQPGCWQDACCLHGTTNMILAAMDDPAWVHEFLQILKRKKLEWVSGLSGAKIDILELGGGDASDTVISPTLFEQFVLPYDRPIVDALHSLRLKCVYHTCGGMMRILDQIKALGADGSETLTPKGMGGNADLSVIKEKLGKKMFLIGGFDQFHGFVNCDVQKTKEMVYECFRTAGQGGGYLLCPSDHFFDANVVNLMAYSEAARECVY
jgi:hypothetical protein